MSILRLAAGAGAALLLLTSSGHPLVLAVLLGVTAASTTAGLTAALAGLGAAIRWGAGSLRAAAGAQAVLGPAVLVGPQLAAAGAGAGALALVVASPGGWASVPFGLAAGLLAAGPAATSGPDGAVRFGAAVVGVGLAWVAGRLLPRAVAHPAAAAAAALALALQVVA